MGIQGRESSERREGGDEVSHLNWSLPKVEDGKGCRVYEAVEKVQDQAIGVCRFAHSGQAAELARPTLCLYLPDPFCQINRANFNLFV